MKGSAVRQPSLRERTSWQKAFQRDWHLYLLLLIPVFLVIVFNYAAYPGLRMVFMDYKPARGYDGSKWVGWQTFQKVFADRDFSKALVNSIVFNLLDLLVSFPMPIILALMLNELRFPRFKKTTQTILYLPHFLSWVIIGSVAYQLFKPNSGIVNAGEGAKEISASLEGVAKIDLVVDTNGASDWDHADWVETELVCSEEIFAAETRRLWAAGSISMPTSTT